MTCVHSLINPYRYMTSEPATTVAVRIWDLPTRLFHWTLAVLVVALVVTGSVGGLWMEWHLRAGMAVLALLLFRLTWGLIGGHWSRFANFLYSPSRILRYLRKDGHALDEAGHGDDGQDPAQRFLRLERERLGAEREKCAEGEGQRDGRAHAEPDAPQELTPVGLDQVRDEDADHEGRLQPLAQPDQIVAEHPELLR